MPEILDLASSDRDSLARLFLGLDAAGRHRRFGGGLSDEAVVRWCAALDPSQAIVVVDAQGSIIDAVVKLLAVDPDWTTAELQLQSGREPITRATGALHLGVSLAASKGCRTVTAAVPAPSANRAKRRRRMTHYLRLMLLCQLVGDLAMGWVGLSFQGPLFGMLILFAILSLTRDLSDSMRPTAGVLIDNLGAFHPVDRDQIR
jgi:hypothetical protein